MNQKAKNALYMGGLCTIAYLAIYIARNVLSAVTPQLVEAGYDEEYVGWISSLYLTCYACGQIINGAIGDKIRAKWMISIGLLGAGITNFVFSRVISSPYGAVTAYGFTGFFLSMIYGPMTKIISENNEQLYATRCSLGYTFASFFGSPMAGVFASFLAWQSVFDVSSAMLVAMAIVGFIVFGVFERSGIIKHGQYKPQEKGLKNVKVLFKHHIIKFLLIAVVTGVVRTSVVFWLPTYFTQHLGYTSQESAGIFTIATFIISFTAFISVFVYEKLGQDMDKTILIMFSISTVFFALVYFVSHPVINIVLLVIAIMGSNASSTMLFARYCPGLKETGMVSSVTGFIDFISYISAAIANVIFPNVADSIGWGNLVIVWFIIVLCGIIIALPYDKMKSRCAKKQAEKTENQTHV